MLARVTNYNIRDRFPTRGGNILLRRGLPYTYDFDPRTIEDLRKYPLIKVEVLEKPKPKTDYAALKAKDLRRMAAESGIKGANSLKKAELIRLLEEKNGKHAIS